MKRTLYNLSIAILVFATSCQSVNSINFPKNESGVYMAQKPTIPKGAVRLVIELSTDLTQGEGEYFAMAEVIEVVGYGATYSRAKLRRGDKIKLSIVEEIEGREFKSGDKVMFDGLTPISKTGEFLDVSML